VLRTACKQARIWQQNGLPDMRIAVNVSCLQFTQPNFATLVAGILAETGLAAPTLELEITESLLMKNEVWTTELLIELRKLGVSVAIDDFGIGYSSLGRLNDFPVNRLKIDRSFVQGVDHAGRHATLVAAILSMAKALGLDVVAEGVEDFNQLLHLQDQHCNEVQGYLLSRPLPVAQATELLERLANSDAASRTMRLRRLAGIAPRRIRARPAMLQRRGSSSCGWYRWSSASRGASRWRSPPCSRRVVKPRSFGY
jgi:EAL domain-containing protein (putative c-di-GMP-specific phosphodiesterase class I)